MKQQPEYRRAPFIERHKARIQNSNAALFEALMKMQTDRMEHTGAKPKDQQIFQDMLDMVKYSEP